MTEFKREDSLGSMSPEDQRAYLDSISEFVPRDSKDVLDWYGHPDEGQGVYVMLHRDGHLSWCPSGNEMRRIHQLKPEAWLTGPVFLPLGTDDHTRFMDEFNRHCDRF